MSKRDDYTAEEWEAIRRAPAESAIAVEQASPSGILGRRRERKAEKRAFGEAIAENAGLELIDAIIAARADEGVLLDAIRAGGEPLVEKAVVTARSARVAIASKGTREELEAYVGAILSVCGAVAMASREGGEAGPTSRAEALVLTRLAGALGRAGYEPPSYEWADHVVADSHARDE